MAVKLVLAAACFLIGPEAHLLFRPCSGGCHADIQTILYLRGFADSSSPQIQNQRQRDLER